MKRSTKQKRTAREIAESIVRVEKLPGGTQCLLLVGRWCQGMFPNKAMAKRLTEHWPSEYKAKVVRVLAKEL